MRDQEQPASDKCPPNLSLLAATSDIYEYFNSSFHSLLSEVNAVMPHYVELCDSSFIIFSDGIHSRGCLYLYSIRCLNNELPNMQRFAEDLLGFSAVAEFLNEISGSICM